MLIPFVVGPCSPNGLEHQQQSEAQWKRAFDEAPMALGSLLGIDIPEIIEDSRTLKMEIASIYPNVDDRICETMEYYWRWQPRWVWHSYVYKFDQ